MSKRLSKIDIAVWLISGIAITGLSLLFMGVMNAPASPYRPTDISSDSTLIIEEVEQMIISDTQNPDAILYQEDSIQ